MQRRFEPRATAPRASITIGVVHEAPLNHPLKPDRGAAGRCWYIVQFQFLFFLDGMSDKKSRRFLLFPGLVAPAGGFWSVSTRKLAD